MEEGVTLSDASPVVNGHCVDNEHYCGGALEAQKSGQEETMMLMCDLALIAGEGLHIVCTDVGADRVYLGVVRPEERARRVYRMLCNELLEGQPEPELTFIRTDIFDNNYVSIQYSDGAYRSMYIYIQVKEQ